MKVIVTGSLGNIGKPLTKKLVQRGHEVTVISRNAERRKDIEALGATAAVGTVEDINFLADTFIGVDAVFCMIPPNFAEIDQVKYYSRIGRNYADAILRAGVKRVVELSSYGAHLEKGTGFIEGSYHVEQLFNKLPDVAVTHIRPGYFYYNLYNFINMIKKKGIIAANFGGEDKLALVSPTDIAAVIAKELHSPVSYRKAVYVVSDDRTCNEVASILGSEIAMPDLKWTILTNEQMHEGLIANGVSAHIAENLINLGAATHSGVLREDFEKQNPVVGEVKIEDFAKEFAPVFNQK